MSVKTEVKERPIIFSGAMVRAILEGRKTQTRRIVSFGNSKPFTLARSWPYVKKLEDGTWMWSDSPDFNYPPEYMRDGVKCPYGRAGDRLWVRETFYHPKGAPRMPVEYKANLEPQQAEAMRWKPSIHMPRWASRIDLEITGIRVERVQEITEKDAIAEGMPSRTLALKNSESSSISFGPIIMFGNHWNKLFGYKGVGDEPYHYGNNPWVWVISFNKILTID